MSCSPLRGALPLVLALSLLTGTAQAAGVPAGDHVARRASPAAPAAPRAAAPVDDLLDDLAAVEDPALADHVAAGLSTTELIIVIVTLILFFPLGIILLIVFLVTD